LRHFFILQLCLAIFLTTGVARAAVELGASSIVEREASSIAGPNGETGEGTSGAPNAGMIALSIEDREKTVKPKRLGLDFFTEIDGFPQAVKDRAASAGLFQYFAHLHYDLTENLSFYIRPQWTTTYDAASGPAAEARGARATTRVGDTVFGVIDSALLKWKGEGSLTGIARYYVGTAEVSRDVGQKGNFYGRLIAQQPLSRRVTALAQLVSWYWIQANNVSFNSSGKYVGNLEAEVTPYSSLTVKLVKHLNFTQSLGLDYIWIHGSKVVSVASQGQTKAYIDTSLVTDAIPHLTVSIGANNEPLLNGGDRFKAFRDSETYFYTMIYATL